MKAVIKRLLKLFKNFQFVNMSEESEKGEYSRNTFLKSKIKY